MSALLVATGATAVAAPRVDSVSRADVAKSVSVAFFAFSTTNNYTDAELTGMKIEAAKLGGVDIHVISANGDATMQYNQLLTAASDKLYQGAIIDPIDNVGVAPAAEKLIKAGTITAAVSNTIGPSSTSLKPQVPGIFFDGTAPNHDTAIMAQQVVSYCANLNPCTVVILIAGLQFPFDKVRYDTFLSVLHPHKNIKVVALGQDTYSTSTALTNMQDILQAHPHFDVLLSDADQETEGAQIALKDAGWNLPQLIGSKKLYIISLGGDQAAMTAVRDGDWSADVGNFPVTAGQYALEEIVNKIRGLPYQQVVDIDFRAPVPLLLTKAVLAKYPSFKGQWAD
jgi:ribose transport system substrate-binding protein